MTDQYHIKGFANTGFKLALSLFCWTLFGIGLAAFLVLDRGGATLFWAMWLGFIGSITLLSMLTSNAVVTADALVVHHSLAGIVPIFPPTVLARTALRGIERRSLKAANYDSDSEGIYRHRIVLITSAGSERELQAFHDRGEQNPPEVLAAAEEIARQLKLPLSHRVESWDA